jgi:hypothetical protein
MKLYTIRTSSGFDGMQIAIDERSGLFMAHGSFGTFAYRWRSVGNRTLKEFLAGLDYYYFMGKAADNRGEVFDFEKSVERIKEDIVRRRREGEIDSEEARRYFDRLDRLENCQDQGFFLHQVYCDRDLVEFYDGDMSQIEPAKVRCAQCNAFWTDIWPKFLEECGAKVAA